MTRIIPVVPIFVMANFIPAILWCTHWLRKALKSMIEHWKRIPVGLAPKLIRTVELFTKTFDTLFVIAMILEGLSYTTTGWPCPVWTIFTQFVFIVFAELHFFSEAWKEASEYIRRGEDGTATVTTFVTDVVVMLALSLWTAVFIRVAFGDWNFFV